MPVVHTFHSTEIVDPTARARYCADRKASPGGCYVHTDYQGFYID